MSSAPPASGPALERQQVHLEALRARHRALLEEAHLLEDLASTTSATVTVTAASDDDRTAAARGASDEECGRSRPRS